MKRIYTLLVISVLIASLVGASLAQGDEHHAQQPAPTMQPGGMPPSAPGGMMSGMMGGMMPGMMSGMPMMCHMCGSIVASGNSIYVLSGNQVFRLDKNDLHVIASATLPMTMMQGGMAGMGGMMQGMQQGGMAGMGGTMPGGMMGMMSPEMQAMMQQMQQMSPREFDSAFLQNMMRHHAGAVSMSSVAKYKADHQELRRFAANVVDSQTAENRQFATWLREWYDTSGSDIPMPQDEQTTQRLRNMSGRDFEIAYMQAMIMHHMSGVQMAQMAVQKASHPELWQKASEIVQVQSAEIQQLRTWLSQWYGISS